MYVFQRLAGLAASQLLGRTAENPASLDELAGSFESIALDDPELAEHYKRLAETGEKIQAVRLLEESA